jgi:hypothetical protein
VPPRGCSSGGRAGKVPGTGCRALATGGLEIAGIAMIGRIAQIDRITITRPDVFTGSVPICRRAGILGRWLGCQGARHRLLGTQTDRIVITCPHVFTGSVPMCRRAGMLGRWLGWKRDLLERCQAPIVGYWGRVEWRWRESL